VPNDDPKKSKKQFGPKTGDPEKFETWEEFWNAWVNQIQFMIKHTAENYNLLGYNHKLRGAYKKYM